jgi:hypothetical protein
MKRCWTILRLVLATTATIAWILSYPTVLGWGSTPLVLRPVDGGPPATQPPPVLPTVWTDYWTRGKTITVRHDVGSTAYTLILWKGSIHLQRRADAEHVRFDSGFHISQSAAVMESFGEENWSGKELYFGGARVHFLGAAWVRYVIDWGGVSGYMTAVAIPLWLIILACLAPSVFRFLKEKRCRHRGFEVVQCPKSHEGENGV